MLLASFDEFCEFILFWSKINVHKFLNKNLLQNLVKRFILFIIDFFFCNFSSNINIKEQFNSIKNEFLLIAKIQYL
jgi:hypothetical protein